MGKYLSVIVGLAAIVFGIWGIVVTWPLLLRAILATVPAMFVLGGLLAVIIGLSEIRDSFASQKSQPSSGGTPTSQKS